MSENPMYQPPVPPAQPAAPVVPPVEAPVVVQTTPPPSQPAAPQAQQVEEKVFLAARLRESLAELANWRQTAAELQLENSQLKARLAQAEIQRLDATYDVGKGTMLVGKEDGTFWRLPKQQQQG